MLRIIKFETRYSTGPDGTRATDWVLVSPIGVDHNKTQTWKRVAKIKPPETNDPNILESLTYQDMAAKWSVIGPEYEAWKGGQELPDTGTPLAAWPAISPEQAKVMIGMGIKTVEDVAALDDESASRIPHPQSRKLPGLASKYLTGESAAQKDSKIAELEAKLEAALEMIEEGAALAEEKPKRGPGRPRKAESEAA